jgi:UDP-glucuronate 4-epimerase
VNFVEGDIRDVETLEKTMKGCDAVVHLAAVAGVRPSLDNPSHYYDINVTGTSNVLEVGRALGIDRYAIASSSSVYGGNTKTPFAESDPVNEPVSPYAASKRSLELLVGTAQRLHGGNMSCLRFFTVYGPRQRPEMAIHKFMRLLVAGESIPMFGDGTSGRDYTYIDDIVAGVRQSLDRADGFNIYNLGGDEVVLLRDLIATIGEVVGVEPNIDQQPMQKGDVFVTNADLTKSRAELDYVPTTSIRDGIEKMWAWYQTVYG